MIKLSELARELNCSLRNLQRKIKDNPDVFDGHITRQGKRGTFLDSTAEEYIRAHSETAPVVIFDADKYAEIESLRRDNSGLAKKLAEQSATLVDVAKELVAVRAELETHKKLLAEAKEETEQLKSRGFFARLFNL